VPDRELARFLTPRIDPNMLPLARGIEPANRLMKLYWGVVRRAL
jgi:hypothetical protein